MPPILPDWGGILTPDQPPLETLLRGILMYGAIIVLMRVVLKRQAGSFGLGDMLLVVLIADAAQNAMIGQANSVTNGVVLVAALLGMNYLVDWASYRWETVRSLLEPAPELLIRDGRLLHEGLRKERITEDELLAQLRINGVGSVEHVFEARIEPEGHISVLPREERPAQGPSDRPSPIEPRPSSGQTGEAEPPEFEAAFAEFLESAQRLRTAVAWHQQRIEEHEQFVKRAKTALSSHGVQAKAFLANDVATSKGGEGSEAES
jgi:uncharacterized membrane protein YcaP (DUF421 family)